MIRLLFIPILFLFLLSPVQAKMLDMIIDTDAGIDDIIAITYLVRAPDVAIKAITIETDGITHQKQAVKNIYGLLSLLNKNSIPVACGQNHPISGPVNRFSPMIMGINDSLAQTPIPAKSLSRIPSCPSAEKLLIEVLDKTQKPMNILAIGPLTNIAKILQKRPDLTSKIAAIYIMGGAIKAHGNIDDVISNANTTAEWNIYLDPEAAEQVIHSKIKIVLVPLDVTNQLPLNSGFDNLIKQAKLPITKFIYELLINNRKTQPPGIWFFWDPLAAVITLHPEIATFTTLNLSVQVTDDKKLGTTYIDNVKGSPVDVVTQVDKQKFMSILSHGLGGELKSK